MAALDILVRTRELPAWERGAALNALRLEGGGPVATALVAAQRLGVQTGFIGTYGGDRLGRVKLQTLSEEGVDVSRAVQLAHDENQVVLVLVQQDSGERVFSSAPVWGLYPLDPAGLDQGYITAAGILHLDGYHSAAALRAAGWMRALGKPVMLDGSATRGPIQEPMRELVRAASVLICGQGFAAALTGLSDIWQAGEAVLAMGPQIVIQTEGRDGSYTLSAQGGFHTPAFAVDAVDTTGAGDVFHGAFLAAMLRGWDLRSMVLFSTAVAALKCRSLGGRPGIPTFAETLRFLAERGCTIGGV